MSISNIYPSSLKQLVESFSALPGIGPKTAYRLAFYVVNIPDEKAIRFSKSITDVKSKIRFCTECSNFVEDSTLCAICDNEERDSGKILVVEDVLALYAFEGTSEYDGKYHVLGGVISPVNGVGPDDINIRSLISRITALDADVKIEIILATNPTLEGEATAVYISELIEELGAKINNNVHITRIARGVPTGADLDYADRVTLSKALEGRQLV